MRHRPPWQQREWVTSAEGRATRIGVAIDCPLCDRIQLPPGAREDGRSPTFTEATLPAGLRRDHRTRAGTWARIVVEEGRVEYHSRARVRVLGAGDVGIAEPDVPHHVVPLGEMRLHVEFYRVE
jgi:tellurite resistance-related uncharacterized protein